MWMLADLRLFDWSGVVGAGVTNEATACLTQAGKLKSCSTFHTNMLQRCTALLQYQYQGWGSGSGHRISVLEHCHKNFVFQTLDTFHCEYVNVIICMFKSWLHLISPLIPITTNINWCVLVKSLDYFGRSLKLEPQACIIMDDIAMRCDDDRSSQKNNFCHKSDFRIFTLHLSNH